MIRTTGKGGFTLIELLVVVAMIALITGAIATSMASAMQRARVQKAAAEVSTLTQAIAAYENFDTNNELPTKAQWSEANRSNIGFLIGIGGKTTTGEQAPALVQAALNSSGVMRDPWGMPYYVMITPGSISLQPDSYTTGYYLPNFYRLSEAERK